MWRNLYRQFTKLEIKSHFTCSKTHFNKNTVNCQNIMIRTVWKKIRLHFLLLLMIHTLREKCPNTELFLDIALFSLIIRLYTTAQLHSIKPDFRFCADLFPPRSVSEIRDGEDIWRWSWLEIRLKAFRWSITPQKQFIIVIIIIIIIIIIILIIIDLSKNSHKL